MAAEDALLFVDANVYLDLYGTRYNQQILEQLNTISTWIFSTRQVVEEFKRKKKKVVFDVLKKFPIIQIAKVQESLPETLLSTQQIADLGSSLKAISELNRELNSTLNASKREVEKQIDSKSDAVWRTLEPIFRSAVSHTAAELERARERRDRGNPPGKGSKVGDQLNWEQLLVRFQSKTRLWIISRDKDFGVFVGGKGTLHEPLNDELLAINKQAEAYLFDDLSKGILDFKANTKTGS